MYIRVLCVCVCCAVLCCTYLYVILLCIRLCWIIACTYAFWLAFYEINKNNGSKPKYCTSTTTTHMHSSDEWNNIYNRELIICRSFIVCVCVQLQFLIRLRWNFEYFDTDKQ